MQVRPTRRRSAEVKASKDRGLGVPLVELQDLIHNGQPDISHTMLLANMVKLNRLPVTIWIAARPAAAPLSSCLGEWRAS